MVRLIRKERLYFSSLKALVHEILDQAQVPFGTQQIIKDLGASVISATKSNFLLHPRSDAMSRKEVEADSESKRLQRLPRSRRGYDLKSHQ